MHKLKIADRDLYNIYLNYNQSNSIYITNATFFTNTLVFNGDWARGNTILILLYPILSLAVDRISGKTLDAETRILFLADPQIEGDAKISKQGIRGEIDLFANDLYFRHIYTSFVSPYSLFRPPPTHVIILGDLFSSQWIGDQEFERRVQRYKWIFGDPNNEYTHKLINLTGNHDIGYNRDMTRYRVNRWEREFGSTNFVEKIPLKKEINNNNTKEEDEDGVDNESGTHHLIVVNAQNIDGPARDEDLRSETWNFLDSVVAEREKDYHAPFILLSHIPLHKQSGLCVDWPMITYDSFNFINEQNHLTPNASKFILTRLKPRFIFAGHDHEGCDVTHVVRVINKETNDYWIESYRTENFEINKNKILSGDDGREFIVREVTVRSAMGGYGGNAGLFEIRRRHEKIDAIIDDKDDEKEFEYHYSSCPFVMNHIPWIVLVIDIIMIIGWILCGLFVIVSLLFKNKAYKHWKIQRLSTTSQIPIENGKKLL
ncbi:3857_t:CDS:2 [Ambispora leptoticha]|uniref:3857_t:CDS:1 n=1 Tax=Ambispora leptoticha TaxID=144679 RepID=A0A9N9D328_9GLOM|nr:3857_t:CDS:2 [Ambispora leptoticha]